MRAGAPSPIGATVTAGGVNFCLFSRTASKIELLLFDEIDSPIFPQQMET